nr:unnamed protein product [Digitaria exilis]
MSLRCVRPNNSGGHGMAHPVRRTNQGFVASTSSSVSVSLAAGVGGEGLSYAGRTQLQRDAAMEVKSRLYQFLNAIR